MDSSEQKKMIEDYKNVKMQQLIERIEYLEGIIADLKSKINGIKL